MDHIKKTKSTSAFNVLLPICTESNTDVFLNVLKNIIARSKVDDHYLDSAFKSGMNGAEFPIDLEDISVNWKLLNSKSQQIRQWKLIGLWAINSFPSLGKKFFGRSYRVPERNAVEVIGNSAMEIGKIDDLIFQKMKLRVIQLNVSESTIIKLKHFVKVSGCIGKSNEIQISTKMKSFDVDGAYVESCWKALKYGQFSMNLDFGRQVETTLTENQSMTSTMSESAEPPICKITIDEHAFRTVSPPKRLCRDRIGEEATNNNSSVDLQIIPPPKMPSSDRNCDDAMNGQNMDDDSSIGSLRKVILQLRHDVGDLTKSVENNGKEQLHVMIIRQKDDEIARLKTSVQELMQANERLIINQSDFQRKIENQTAVINALEKGFEANLKLQTKLESDLAASLDFTEKLKRDNTEKELQIQDWIGKLAEAEKELIGANKKLSANKKFQDDIAALKNQSTTIVAELEYQIKSMNANLAAWEEANLKAIKEKEQLEQDLNVLKLNAASKAASRSNVGTQTGINNEVARKRRNKKVT